jgi:hypothetical protein
MTWDQVLDDLESATAALEATSAGDDVPAGPVDLSFLSGADGIGALPAASEARARALLGRLQAAEGALRARRDDLGRELALVGGDANRAPVARYLDTSA